MKALLAIFILGVIGVGAAAAQDPGIKSVRVDILNGKATSLPFPEYPEGAKSAGIGGTVAVDVVIDENGQVISAIGDPMDQHAAYDANGVKLASVAIDPMLRESAENAARMAKFSPTLLSGVPVQVKGRILYNFASTTEARLPPHADNPDSGSMINADATSLPQPAYPAAARAVKAQGQVMVRIEIDTEGNVTSATALSGHPLLRAAAQNAASAAKFKPSADAAKAPRSGVLVYSFQISTSPQ